MIVNSKVNTRLLIFSCICILFPCISLPAEDDMTSSIRNAFKHDPSVATIQCNSGHFTNMTAISCNGKYLFGANNSEISIRERNSLRVIKSFPIKGVSEIVPDLIDEDLIILHLEPFIYNWKENQTPPSIILNWKTGNIVGHIDKYILPNTLNANNETFVWDNNLGFIPSRNPKSYSGDGYLYYGQGTVDINSDDSILVISSMNPLVWNMKYARMESVLHLSDWIIENDNTLNNSDILSLLPKPKKWNWKNNRALYNRNHFSAKFIDKNTIKVGGPTPNLSEWNIDGTFRKSDKLPLSEGIIFDFSYFDGKVIVATSDGFYMVKEDSTIIRLDELCNEHSNLPKSRNGVANVVSECFNDKYFISSLCRSQSSPLISIGNIKNGKIEKSLFDNSWGEILDVKISMDNKKAIATNAYSIAELSLDKKKDIPINIINVPTGAYSGGDFLHAVEFLPNGRYAIGTSYGDLKIYDTADKSWSQTNKMHRHDIRSLTLTHDKTKLISSDSGNTTVIWNSETLIPILTINNFWPFGILMYTPDGYYSYETISSGLGSISHISKDNRTYSFDQFDLTLNRPDIIAQRLGADQSYINKLYKAWQKRVLRNGFEPLKMASGYHTPEIEIINKDQFTSSIKSDQIKIKLRFIDTIRSVDRIHVKNNGVPVPSENGIIVTDNKPGVEQLLELNLNLRNGINHISVQSINDQGAKSLSDEISIIRESANPPSKTLWIISAGVSDYDDKSFRLSYAAKDAKDIATILSKTVNTFDDVRTLVLTDKDFTQQSLKRIRDFISPASIDDAIVVFFAGHGVLDSNLDYYLAPLDMDFYNPQVKGIPVSDITNIIEMSSPLDRYIIIDACHSGVLDKDDYVAESTIQINDMSDIHFRSAGSIRLKNREASEISNLASSIFEDLNTSAGITYMSSASGNEVAVESDLWENGLFTKAFKDALLIDNSTNRPVCMKDNIELTIDEVFDYAKNSVVKISQNLQNPRIVSISGKEKLTIIK